jgi:hypothetical protein
VLGKSLKDLCQERLGQVHNPQPTCCVRGSGNWCRPCLTQTAPDLAGIVPFVATPTGMYGSVAAVLQLCAVQVARQCCLAAGICARPRTPSDMLCVLPAPLCFCWNDRQPTCNSQLLHPPGCEGAVFLQHALVRLNVGDAIGQSRPLRWRGMEHTRGV